MRLPKQVARNTVVLENRHEAVPGASREAHQGRIQIKSYELIQSRHHQGLPWERYAFVSERDRMEKSIGRKKLARPQTLSLFSKLHSPARWSFAETSGEKQFPQ